MRRSRSTNAARSAPLVSRAAEKEGDVHPLPTPAVGAYTRVARPPGDDAGTDDVEVTPRRGMRSRSKDPQADGSADEAQRYVDVEDTPASHGVDEYTAEQEAGDESGRRHRAVGAKDKSAGATLGEGGRHDRQRRGRHHGAPTPRSARATTRIGRLTAAPPAADAIANPTRPAMNSGGARRGQPLARRAREARRR